MADNIFMANPLFDYVMKKEAQRISVPAGEIGPYDGSVEPVDTFL